MGAGDFKPDQKQGDSSRSVDMLQPFRDAVQKDRDNARVHLDMGHKELADKSLRSAERRERQIKVLEENAQALAYAQRDAEGKTEDQLKDLIRQAYIEFHDAEAKFENTRKIYFEHRIIDKPESAKSEEEKEQDKHLAQLKRIEILAQMRHSELERLLGESTQK